MTGIRRPQRTDASTSDPLVAVACPDCHAALAAPWEAAGTSGRCPLCRAPFLLPIPAPGEPAAPDRAADDADGSREADPVRLSREEKARRRARRNVVMLVSGVVILLTIVLLFSTRRPRKRR